MTVTFRELLEPEDERLRADGIAYAWDRWREASCEEWNGGHLWSLLIDCGSASLRCSAGCGAEPYPDASEVLTGEFPVKVNVVVEKYDVPWCPPEYDVWVEVEPK